MPFEIVRNDIVNMSVDAIVNTANPRPVIGSGTDAAIHEKAGPLLLQSRRLIGIIETGEAAITLGFRLPAKYVIHTVGPVWQDGCHGEALLLRQCYENSLKLAARHRLKSVAFPLISTGNYGFPNALALEIAKDAITKFLKDHDMQIYLVVFSRESFELSGALFQNVKSYIDENYVQDKLQSEYGFAVREEWEAPRDDVAYQPEPCAAPDFSMECPQMRPSDSAPERKKPRRRDIKAYGGRSTGRPPRTPFDPQELGGILENLDAGFSETLLKLIDRSGKKDSEVYKKANVDRKLFSKIRNNPNYKPSKATALAFAIALELDLEQTKDFIGRAGYALTRSSKFDMIIQYFIVHGRYDIHEINLMLFQFDQSLLGG